MIIIPAFSWFRAGNAYTGSSGTDPSKGALCVKTFHFKLEIIQDEDGNKQIKATGYMENPWPDGKDESTVNSSLFPFDTEGLEQAKAWLGQEEKRLLHAD